MTPDTLASQEAAILELSQLYLFKSCPQSALRTLVEQSRLLRYEAGQVLFEAGDPADNALLVITGKLSVTLPVGKERRSIGDIRVGEVVGETALLSHNGLRGATVVSATASTALELTPELMLELATNPCVYALETHLLGSMARRIREINLNIKKASRDSNEAGPEREGSSLLGRLRSFFGGAR